MIPQQEPVVNVSFHLPKQKVRVEMKRWGKTKCLWSVSPQAALHLTNCMSSSHLELWIGFLKLKLQTQSTSTLVVLGASTSIKQRAIPPTAWPVYPQHKPCFRHFLPNCAKGNWVLCKHSVCVWKRPLACDSRVCRVYFGFSFLWAGFLFIFLVRNLLIFGLF